MRASACSATFGFHGKYGSGRGVKLCSRSIPLVLFSTSEEKRGRGLRNGKRASAWRQVLLRSGGKALKGEPHGRSGMKQDRKGRQEVTSRTGGGIP
jgi:hypothetical protein